MNSYPSPRSIGDRFGANTLLMECDFEEKIDGSQFSFGVYQADSAEPVENTQAFEFRVASKGGAIDHRKPDGMFKAAVEAAREAMPLLSVNFTYRAEVLSKPRHNILTYERVPKGNFIIFDIQDDQQKFLTYEEKTRESNRCGFEVVPRVFQGVPAEADLTKLLDIPSILGGKIEGLVMKPLIELKDPDGKRIVAKYVSDNFKEVARVPIVKDHREPTFAILGSKYRTEARWHKAVQHLREAGKLSQSPKDIGLLVREVPEDVLQEYREEIKQDLLDLAWPEIRKHLTTGLPEWYKKYLEAKAREELIINNGTAEQRTGDEAV